jgi:arylsulfatase A-like enzyme
MKPNILIFMTDQQQAAVTRPDHPCKTPHLDAFGAQGVRFDRAYTPCPLCAPARASMMTGLYPHRHGMRNNPHVAQAISKGLRENFPMFSDRLKDAGYDLRLHGKWHVSETTTPADHGWIEPDRETQKKLWSWPSRRENIQDGYWLDRPGYEPYLLYGITKGGEEEFPESQWSRYTADTIKELGKGTAPWCVFLGLHGPHDPYIAPAKYARMYDPLMVPKPASFEDQLIDKPAVYRRERWEVWKDLEWGNYAAATALYWAYNTLIDVQFGEVMAALDATGQADNTLVVFVSDHGDMMGAHGLFFKGVTAFEECYRIPLFARCPALFPGGKVCDEFATLIDLAPTFIEAGQGDPLPECHGRSLLPLLRGENPPDWPQDFLGQFHGSELLYTQRVLATKTHKYVFNGFDFDELYDLEKDPAETRNLYFSQEHQDVLEDSVARLWKRSLAVGDTISCLGYPTTDLVPRGPLP